eukprot:5144260-Karenia_brevis.AAC.1
MHYSTTKQPNPIMPTYTAIPTHILLLPTTTHYTIFINNGLPITHSQALDAREVASLIEERMKTWQNPLAAEVE